VTVVVLSITPERLRGVLTRWLLEIMAGVYVGKVSARVREHIWTRILEDVGKGRALMVWSRHGEQGLDFRTYNHSWETVDLDGITLMRRPNKHSARTKRRKPAADSHILRDNIHEHEVSSENGVASFQSNAGRHRRYLNEVERRHKAGSS